MHRQVADAQPILLKLLRVGFGAGGMTSLALGIWMLIDPAGWRAVFPGAIEDFGAFNPHFIRDLGGWYAAGGLLLLLAFTNPARLGGIALLVTLVGYGTHAAVHIGDIVSGTVPASHWIIDLPTVFLPVMLVVLLLWIWWSMQATRIGPLEETQVIEEEWDPEVAVR